MEKKIDYTTPKQQIETLKNKGLLFDNEIAAEKRLKRYGYYNIINSYKEPYQILFNNERKYISGTTFEQIFSMFSLDHNLRNSIMASMLDLEECLRAAVAEIIAHNFGTDHKNYLKFRNYRDRYSKNPKFSLNGILGKLWNNASSDKDPIKYYREKYGIVPPWILLKGTYFSTLVNLIKCFKSEQKQQLISVLLNIPPDLDITEEITTLFQNVLFICLDYRNAAAHGGRIYNFHSQYLNSISISDDLINIFPDLSDMPSSSGIGQLIILLSIFKYTQPIHIILNTLDDQVNRHLKKYPNDIDVLSQNIGISIQSDIYVWVNEKTGTYHTNKFCSGLLNATKIPFNTLDQSKYHPCKRCFHDIEF